jgi:hypothetical protein
MIQTETADELRIHILFSIYIFSQNLALYMTMWRNLMHSNNITRRIRSTWRISKATIRTLRIGNNSFVSSLPIFRRTPTNDRLHVRCQSLHTFTTHETTPLCFMTHQKCYIAYGCCQLDSVFHWFPKLNTHRISDGFVIESYKFSRKVS